jgi:hypothetical protein
MIIMKGNDGRKWTLKGNVSVQDRDDTKFYVALGEQLAYRGKSE